MWARALFPLLRGVMVRGMRITPEASERSRRVVDGWFERVAARLGGGRRYLVGDRLTAADLTFAALATPVVQPEAWRRLLPEELVTPPAAQAIVDQYRATPAGRFVLRLYDEDR